MIRPLGVSTAGIRLRLGLGAALFLTVAGSPLAGQEADPLVGTWAWPRSPQVPESCSEATVEYRTDGTLEAVSGAQVIRAAYAVEDRGEGAYLLVQSDVTINDEPNCQGVDPQTVLDAYVVRAYVVVDGDELRMHVGDTPDAPSFVMTRVEG